MRVVLILFAIAMIALAHGRWVNSQTEAFAECLTRNAASTCHAYLD